MYIYIYIGAACEAEHQKIETESCNAGDCIVDCQGGWTDWTNCDVTCGAGQKTRTFFVNTEASNGGMYVCLFNLYVVSIYANLTLFKTILFVYFSFRFYIFEVY